MITTMTRVWIITQVGDDGLATAVRKTSTYYANLNAVLEAHGQNFIKWSDDTTDIDVPGVDEVAGKPF